jgi:flagellar biogenesis protein FliO
MIGRGFRQLVIALLFVMFCLWAVVIVQHQTVKNYRQIISNYEQVILSNDRTITICTETVQIYQQALDILTLSGQIWPKEGE